MLEYLRLKMDILGISAFYHDSAACLIRDGEILAAAAEERFSRCKNDPGFPEQATSYCLKTSGKIPDFIIFYDKPWLKFERLLESYICTAPKGFESFMKSIPLWMKEKLFLKELIATELCTIIEKLFPADNPGKKSLKGKIRFAEHHQSHAASAFYPSPFQEAAILSIDGVGEWATTSIAHGSDNKIKFLKELHFPHSLGLLYSAFTYYTGFKVNSGEYKLMGLAPYGQPSYSTLIREKLIDIRDDGSFQLNMEYFGFLNSDYMTNDNFHRQFGSPPRTPESPLTQRDMDIAASIQCVTEEIILKQAKHAAEITKSPRLCLAGGVALNCVANRILRQKSPFTEIWVQPAAGDCGGALGAALAFYYAEMENQRPQNHENRDLMKNALLGPEYSDMEIKDTLERLSAVYQKATDQQELLKTTARALQAGKVVGWHQGRMEFGPRALGNRSILANPTIENMQSLLNQKIKFRESFRPFAPAAIAEKVAEWFIDCRPDPYMLFTTEVHPEKRLEIPDTEKIKSGMDKLHIKRSQIPAVTHVDFSARLQTVSQTDNPLFYRLLQEFENLSNCPVLVNTSFNVRGEPIVCTPEDAWFCFMNTDMDLLVINNFLLWKNEQTEQRQKRTVPEKNNHSSRLFTTIKNDKKTLKLFGLSLSTMLLLLSAWLYHKYGNSALLMLLPVAILPGISLIKPALLQKIHYLSTRGGQYMGMIIAKIVLFLLFFLVILPTGLLFRLIGRDPLRRSIYRKTTSLWLEREKQPETMTLQF